MEIYDIKFNDEDISMLQSMIGKCFEYYRADPFMYSTSVYGEVELEDGLEISFEKDVWFSEDIIVNKGYKLEDKFNDVQEFVDDWKEKAGYVAKCSRTYLILK